MIRSVVFFALSLILSIPAFSQVTVVDDQLTLLDAVSASKFPKRWYEIQWISDDAFVYTTDFATLNLWQKGETTDFLIGADLLPEGVEVRGGVDGLRWEDDEKITYVRGNRLCQYDLATESASILMEWPAEAENLDRSPKMAVAYVLDGNLYVSVPGEEEARQITTDGSADIAYGEAAHRSEFGITKGIFWSNDGAKVAFYRIDQSAIPDYPLINQQVIPATTNNIRYPMAGLASQKVTMGVYDLTTSELIYLDTSEPEDEYLTNLTWSPDDKMIYLAVVNRDQNHMWLRRYDAATGEVDKLLFEETDEEYVEPEHGLMFHPEMTDRFLWFSERDGWQHLYEYRTDGMMISQVTKGEFDVTEFHGFIPKSNSILVSSKEESPLETHVYRVNLEDGKSTKLTEAAGSHSATISPRGDQFLDSWSSVETPWNIQLSSTRQGKVQEELYQAENPFGEMPVGEMEMVKLTAEDGTPLYGRVIKPVGFEPTKQYPAIVYVYGGPHVQLVENRWLGGASMYLYYLAQQGYVVWTLDNRGTPGRGIEFEQAVHRHLGTKEIEDQITGATYLKSLPYVDADRLGVHGWSYGGFMTTSLMTRTPGVFKVGVAGGPVIDWSLYEVMYGERYMDTPEQNPEGYEEAKLVNYADDLEGKLLIIHGQQDDVVVPQHSFQYIRRCVELGKQVDYFPYPTHPHNVRGRDRMHLLEKITLYFDENL